VRNRIFQLTLSDHKSGNVVAAVHFQNRKFDLTLMLVNPTQKCSETWRRAAAVLGIMSF
jgi:hypothetical protein